MSRNKDRLGGHKPENTEAPTQFNPLNFVTPTEFVELPSQGRWYPEDHPLKNQETIEIKFMTAKDEDILTSQTLLKKGIALDRLLENILVDKSIDPDSLMIGDKNAILVALRASGFGADYDARVNCSQCSTSNYINFNLNEPEYIGREIPEELNLTISEAGTITTTMPFTKFKVEFRFMNGADESSMSKRLIEERNQEISESLLTEQYKRMIISVEGHNEQEIVDQYVDNMPTVDSRHIKLLLKNITPNIRIKSTLVCRECGHEEEVDVPFGTDFFWPDL